VLIPCKLASAFHAPSQSLFNLCNQPSLSSSSHNSPYLSLLPSSLQRRLTVPNLKLHNHTNPSHTLRHTCLLTCHSPMDAYTTSFTYPRWSRPARSSSLPAFHHGAPPARDLYPSSTQMHHHSTGNGLSEAPISNSDADAVQKLTATAMALHGCHISYALAEQARGWNFYITGAYQQVMFARGMILRECPVQVRPSLPQPPIKVLTFCQHHASVKVTRSDILDYPSSKPTLKPHLRVKLDEIASQTRTHIAVVNSSSPLSNRTPPDGISSNAGWTGLETDRVCELLVTGKLDPVELARVRLLIMLEELVSLLLQICQRPERSLEWSSC
jgi:hypothetical protein